MKMITFSIMSYSYCIYPPPPPCRACCTRPDGIFTTPDDEMVVTFRSKYPSSQANRVGFEMCVYLGKF